MVVSTDVGDSAPGATKHGVVNEIGERGLLLPTLVNSGLEANDRAKYLLTLLQAAREHADDPSAAFSVLRDERLAAGVADDTLDQVIEQSRRESENVYFIPGGQRLVGSLVAAVSDLIAPLVDAGEDRIDTSRLDALRREIPDLTGDRISGSYIARIASADRARGDSFHLLIMDAHRALNQLQVEIATEVVNGASVYRLAGDDRQLVSAFMAGLHRTAPLKFDHPGLGTTATRVGERLLIQNDIGQTEAHIVVIAVEELGVAITYTDVHPRRLRFFQSMLGGFPVEWSDAHSSRGVAGLGAHHLITGRFVALDHDALCGFLQHLGSRLVFLIDWNRARKQLVPLVGPKDAIDLLWWAADADIGHIAFLRLGGQRLVFDAVELAATVPPRYGDPLKDLLGGDVTLAVVRFALQAAADGLRNGKSAQLIRDELRVELQHHMHAAQTTLLDAAVEHVSLTVEAALTLQSTLLHLATGEGDGFARRAARRAEVWEHEADRILGGLRVQGPRVKDGAALVALMTIADDAIDDLEEACFLLTLLPADAAAMARPVLDPLAAAAALAAREHLKAMSIAREVVDGGGPADLEDFLVAVDRVVRFEHEADVADRLARAAIITQAGDFHSLYAADCISRAIENATDALMRSSLRLRDYILGRTVLP